MVFVMWYSLFSAFWGTDPCHRSIIFLAIWNQNRISAGRDLSWRSFSPISICGDDPRNVWIYPSSHVDKYSMAFNIVVIRVESKRFLLCISDLGSCRKSFKPRQSPFAFKIKSKVFSAQAYQLARGQYLCGGNLIPSCLLLCRAI